MGSTYLTPLMVEGFPYIQIKCKLKYPKTNRIEIIIIIMATIIDKAREYSPDNNESKDAFLNGALWMLEKACEYMKNQYPAHYQDYQEWVELADEYVKQFKKSMEE